MIDQMLLMVQENFDEVVVMFCFFLDIYFANVVIAFFYLLKLFFSVGIDVNSFLLIFL